MQRMSAQTQHSDPDIIKNTKQKKLHNYSYKTEKIISNLR